MENSAVFISYSHKDRSVCEKIVSFLESEGLSVWYDKGLVPGALFRIKIAEVIAGSDYFMVLISKSSISSDWVIDEVEYAKIHHKKIIPVWIENTELPVGMDMILQRYHSLFWHLRASDEQFQSSLHSVFCTDDNQNTDVSGDVNRNEFSETENKKMLDLLNQEKQCRYSFCYKADNACYLGIAYLFGIHCDADREKSSYYFRIADYFGNIDGSFYLQKMILDDRQYDTWDEPDEEFCKPIMEKIFEYAGRGSLYAKLYLGNDYWYGRFGLPADKVKSAALYEECAKEGNARAQYMMSANYYYGDGVPQDYRIAIMFSNLALEQKYYKAWRRWGKFYRDGLAVPQNYQKARECYEKGAATGDDNCYNKIGDMIFNGWGFPVDYSAAYSYYLKGEKAPLYQRYCLQKSKIAIGRCLENGLGVAQNLTEACQKYLEGYQFGSPECKTEYLRLSEILYGHDH